MDVSHRYRTRHHTFSGDDSGALPPGYAVLAGPPRGVVLTHSPGRILCPPATVVLPYAGGDPTSSEPRFRPPRRPPFFHSFKSSATLCNFHIPRMIRYQALSVLWSSGRVDNLKWGDPSWELISNELLLLRSLLRSRCNEFR